MAFSYKHSVWPCWSINHACMINNATFIRKRDAINSIFTIRSTPKWDKGLLWHSSMPNREQLCLDLARAAVDVFLACELNCSDSWKMFLSFQCPFFPSTWTDHMFKLSGTSDRSNLWSSDMIKVLLMVYRFRYTLPAENCAKRPGPKTRGPKQGNCNWCWEELAQTHIDFCWNFVQVSSQ